MADSFESRKTAFLKERAERQSAENAERVRKQEEKALILHQAKLDKQKTDHAKIVESHGGEEAYISFVKQKKKEVEDMRFKNYVARQEKLDIITEKIRTISAWMGNAARCKNGRDLAGAVVQIISGQGTGNIGFVVSSDINISGNHIDDIFNVRIDTGDYSKLKTEFLFVRDRKLLQDQRDKLWREQGLESHGAHPYD